MIRKARAMLLAFVCVSFATAQDSAPKRLEPLLMLPEPRAMRSEFSVVPKGAVKTVFTPAREIADVPGITTYSKEDLKRLGVSPGTFMTRAQTAADKLLASLKPVWERDEKGRILYAVFRDERPIIASLLIAPSLPKLFEETFGPRVWVALPTRRALFVFPAKPEALQDFTPDLAERFRDDPYAASPEIFELKSGSEPEVIASFDE